MGHRRFPKTLVATVLTALAGCTTHQAANDAPNRRAAIDAYFASDFTCDEKDAVAVDFQTLQRKPADDVDKCIRFQAFSNGKDLFASAKESNPSDPSAASNIRIGVYWKEGAVDDSLRHVPSFVRVVGRLRSCIRRYDLITEEAKLNAERDHEKPHEVMLSGPCHYISFAVFASQASILPTAMD
jgi:hypothetical protein